MGRIQVNCVGDREQMENYHRTSIRRNEVEMSRFQSVQRNSVVPIIGVDG